ncbi:MAG: formate C-acetyltransferase/glycerol dehydratase family glycyl radical enzyme [Candidatus Latescibacteria bacterium]|nr:formate C-acetyltransferase/glycerol dehydratase family glycyl radical enzyme [Candidatus Latescibacterota bacterium]NIO28438.1 formate C-acetyltransferase/glycerol dehydratase family glycyl radical enzyme [Candidatus Latescibacterota bacterium]NIO55987.1 formate C-acetyltransferase/glycerol dehydratase family glycyl radical enzyme [Candidatus Latescibacterota bacterium]NIT01951.1 formate C-acetyltransferase/glycerol dehydratase family glycyl radical enzyme [Candidatus Latescibacterota bacter
MNERIKRLRQQSLDAVPYISMERAELLTRFYESETAERVSVPVARAFAFKYLLENKQLCINEGELIVGERGPAPKATPTYPEICTHTMNDFDVLHNREKVSFNVTDDAREIQAERIIPFWSGRSIRDRIFGEVDEEWKAAYDAGIFTEFMEQRAPGHTVLDNKIYKKGFLDFRKDIQLSLQDLDFYSDPEAFEKREQLKAMDLAADAIMLFAKRHAQELKVLAKNEADPQRKNELEQMARICECVPANAPETFWEALQYYWFVHLGVITELNTWDSFNPGRLDQHLLPFYERDLEAGILTKERARELLQSFWIKFNNQPAPPKVGVTAKESNTYTDFCLINLGGVKETGEDAANELTYLILDVIEEMRLLQPSSMVQVSKKNPDRLLLRALKIIKTGYGQPSLFNTDAIVPELVRQGKSIEDARNGGASGCVETGAFGKESYILTGYFNLPKVLEIVLNSGIDPMTGKQIGVGSGDPKDFKTFDDLFEAFEKQLRYFIDVKIKGNNIIERLWATYLPAPFLSILIDDCIRKGKDYNNGGARYNTSYIQGVGMGSITDSLTAIKYHVFDNHNLNLSEMFEALNADFDGFEQLRQTLIDETPKYGNDDDYPDQILRRIFESYFEAIDGRPNTKDGHHRVNLLPTTCHVYFGSVVGAMPDGRKAGEPLSEGISPVQGADRKGPTAVLKSAAKIDHLRTGGTLLNQKFTPQVLADEDGLVKLAHLIRSYFKMDGHHLQFNVVTAETLRKAQKEPDKYRDLIVRVAGYSDYFVDLGVELQNEIIKRTEQGLQ